MATTTVNLLDQLGGKELKARYADEAGRATNDGAGNNIATQLSTKIEGVANSPSFVAPTTVVVVSALPNTRDPNTIYLIPETIT